MDLMQAIKKAENLANKGKFAEADKICRDIIAVNDRFHPAFHLLGQLAAHANRNDIAVPMLRRAASLNPNNAQYQRDLAEVLLFSARVKNALDVIEHAVILEPQDPKAHFILGLTTMSLGLLDRAIEAYRTAIKLEPEFGAAHNNLGSLLERAGNLKEAKKAYAKAISIDPGNVQAQNNMASILIAEGNIKAAIIHLETAIKVAPGYIEAHHNLSTLKTYKKNDQHIIQLQSLSKHPSRLTKENQIRLEFILGKAASDIGNYDEAFMHYDRGNLLKRSTFEYDENASRQLHKDIKKNFITVPLNNLRGKEAKSPIPIFIVGMPRSGSTLVEQILVSHDDISSVGEMTALNEIIKKHINDFPNGIKDLSNQDYENIGSAYIAALRDAGADTGFVIDKMLGNYRLLGIIGHAFPHAKIIHTTRNPMDSCVSIYTRLFLETLHYGYDLNELGNFYNFYSDLMEHWRKILPNDMFIDISYEEVVSDLKSASEKLINFIGLEWQENMLDFHKQGSTVRTASAEQVRKPIYKSSVERWRVYEKQLQPLKKILGGK
jgi:tetratricopeptide (TPR) repeat protein